MKAILPEEHRAILDDIEAKIMDDPSPITIRNQWQRVQPLYDSIKDSDDTRILNQYSQTLSYKLIRSVVQTLREPQTKSDLADLKSILKEIPFIRNSHKIFEIIENHSPK